MKRLRTLVYASKATAAVATAQKFQLATSSVSLANLRSSLSCSTYGSLSASTILDWRRYPFQESFWEKIPSSSSFSSNGYWRPVHTQPVAVNQKQENADHNEVQSPKASNSDIEVHNQAETDGNAGIKGGANSNLKISARHDLAMIFTCKVCDTRSIKTVCRESYEKGVVVVSCGGCNNLHLIADRLGWFGEPGSIEDLLAARGEEVKKGSVDSLNLTLDDFAGRKP